MKVKSIRYAGKEDVYNMEVEDTHDFVIQGGVVAHNCADEFRYWAMSRPIKPKIIPEDDGFNSSPQHLFLDIKREDIIPLPKKQRFEVIK